eukprot:2322363-Rhodomonas_salina.3
MFWLLTTDKFNDPDADLPVSIYAGNEHLDSYVVFPMALLPQQYTVKEIIYHFNLTRSRFEHLAKSDSLSRDLRVIVDRIAL